MIHSKFDSDLFLGYVWQLENLNHLVANMLYDIIVFNIKIFTVYSHKQNEEAIILQFITIRVILRFLLT